MGKFLIFKGADFSANSIQNELNYEFNANLNLVIDKNSNTVVYANPSNLKRGIISFSVDGSLPSDAKFKIESRLDIMYSGLWYYNQEISLVRDTVIDSSVIIEKPTVSEWASLNEAETPTIGSFNDLRFVTFNIAPNPVTSLSFYTESELLEGISIWLYK